MAALAAVLLLLGPPGASAGTLSGYLQLILDGHPVKWGGPGPGTGVVVTYATAAADRSFAGARNCPEIRRLDTLLQRNRIAAAAFASELDQAFKVWSDVANIAFVRTTEEEADIVIGAEAKPFGRAFTNVDYDGVISQGGPRPITQSVICLNPLAGWKVGFDGNLEVYDLRYALMHEIGHAIGLNHPGRAGEVMDFRYREEFRTPQAGDIAGVVALYGANANLAAARSMAEPASVVEGMADNPIAPLGLGAADKAPPSAD